MAVTKDELDFLVVHFVNEARGQDGKYISLFLSNIGQFCNAAAVTDERERGGGENKLKESENMFFNLSLKLISGSKYPPSPNHLQNWGRDPKTY